MDAAILDPCIRRTRAGVPCSKASHHRGACTPDVDVLEAYHVYAAHVRTLAQSMTRGELGRAADFHLLAWKILHDEYNAR